MSPSIGESSFETKSLCPQADMYAAILKSLSEQEGAAFKAFRARLTEEGMRDRPEGLSDHDLCDGINDDATLLRFLRARSYVVDDAVKQFTEAFSTRTQADLGRVYDIQDVNDFEETRKLYSHWTGRRDKRGFPILVLDVKSMDSKAMAAYTKSCNSRASHWPVSGEITVEQLRSLAFHDDLVRFILPLCSAAKDRPNPSSPVTGTVHIAEISTLGLRQFWNLKNFLLNFAKVLSTNMPETLDAVLVIGSPSYFPTIWAWIKKFIDPGTVNKLNILRANEVLPTLQSYMDMENIPKRYGGNFDYEHGMPVSLDPALRELLSWSSSSKTYPSGPMKWIEAEDGTHIAVATGTVIGKKRFEKVATLKSAPKKATSNVKMAESGYETSNRSPSMATKSKSVSSRGDSLKTNEESISGRSKAESFGSGVATPKRLPDTTDRYSNANGYVGGAEVLTSGIGVATTDERRQSNATTASDRTLKSNATHEHKSSSEGHHHHSSSGSSSGASKLLHKLIPSKHDSVRSHHTAEDRHKSSYPSSVSEKVDSPLEPLRNIKGHAAHRGGGQGGEQEQDPVDAPGDDTDEFHDASDYHQPSSSPTPTQHQHPTFPPAKTIGISTGPTTTAHPTSRSYPIPPPTAPTTCTCICTCSAKTTHLGHSAEQPTNTTTTITITVATSTSPENGTTSTAVSVTPAGTSAAQSAPVVVYQQGQAGYGDGGGGGLMHGNERAGEGGSVGGVAREREREREKEKRPGGGGGGREK